MLVLGLRCTWSAGGRCQHSWAQPRGGSWPLPREVALARCLRIGFQARSFLFQTNFFIFLNIQGFNWVSPNRFRMGCCSWEGCKRFCCKYICSNFIQVFQNRHFSSPGLRSAIALTSDCAATKFGRQSKDKWAPFSFLGPIKAIPGQLWDYYGRAAQITTILGLSLGIVLQCCTIFYFKFSLGIAQFRFPSVARDTPAFFNLLATLVKIKRDKGWKLKKTKTVIFPH